MKRKYEVVYEPVDDGWIMARVPELPGAVTQGKNMTEARAMIKQAVELLLQSHREHARNHASDSAVWETLSVECPASRTRSK